jgi:hypothetical protein
MADSIYDLDSAFLTINSTRIVGQIIDIPASLVGLARRCQFRNVTVISP